jgi:hypothetical protein
MYNLLKKIIYTCVLTGMFAYSSSTLAENFVVIDHKFSMSDPAFGDINGGGGGQVIGTPPWGTIVENVYQGTNSTNDIVDFTFFGVPVHVYTAITNQGTPGLLGSPAGSIPGGPAPTIDRVGLTADMSSWFAEWSGTEFSQGNNSNWTACIPHPNYHFLDATAYVTDNLDGTYTIDWNSCITGGSFNSQVGFWQITVDCTTCAPVNMDPPLVLTASQGGGNTQIAVVATGGDVTITSPIGAAPANHTFVWTSKAGVVDTDGDLINGEFVFDSTATAVGSYEFTVSYTDDTNFPTSVDKGNGSIAMRVVATNTLDILDDDSDGIINEYDDAALAVTQLQAENSNSATYVIVSDKGDLKLGHTAFCADTAARMSLSGMAAFAGSNCTAITNSSDDDSLIRVGVGGYHDFELHGLTMGDVAQIVIPLNEAIPASAVYRKFNNNRDVWGTFITGNGDLLASASATSAGVCPVPGSASYTDGLTEGDTCMQLTITDGGTNDADGSANGQIIDPGALAEVKSGTNAQLSGCSISGNPQNLSEHSEWLLLAIFIAWLGFVGYRRKQAE